MKIFKIILFVALLIIPSICEARVCVAPRTCGNTIGCISVLKGFSSYLSFNTWLTANPYVEYEVVYATSTNITIVLWTSNCVYTEQCWDKTGVCSLQ
jgi:hypothetical protein